MQHKVQLHVYLAGCRYLSYQNSNFLLSTNNGAQLTTRVIIRLLEQTVIILTHPFANYFVYDL